MRSIPETYIVFVDHEPFEAFGYRNLAGADADKIRAAFRTAGHNVSVEIYKAYIPDLMHVLVRVPLAVW